MILEELEKEYGKEFTNKIKKWMALKGITGSLTKKGKTDIPKSAVRLAYKDIMNR